MEVFARDFARDNHPKFVWQYRGQQISFQVAGDCTFFDCKRLPGILEAGPISSVPIGIPITNCKIVLFGEPDKLDEGEMHVTGPCLFAGYLDEILNNDFKDTDEIPKFGTGDFAKLLHSGDLVFVGRKDRTVKISGQRVALEEIESTLIEHPEVKDAAVTFHGGHGMTTHLEAFFVTKSVFDLPTEHYWVENLITSIRKFLIRKLPTAMIPTYYYCVGTLPKSASGKIDYYNLKSPGLMQNFWKSKSDVTQSFDARLQHIKEVFGDALRLSEVLEDDDFFLMGGNSIMAAQVAHELGIDMRLLYIFPSPRKLLNSLIDSKDLYENLLNPHPGFNKKLKVHHNSEISLDSFEDGQSNTPLAESLNQQPDMVLGLSKIESLPIVEMDKSKSSLSINYSLQEGSEIASESAGSASTNYWPKMCSFGRCNQYVRHFESELIGSDEFSLSIEASSCRKRSLQELWKVLLNSCVDASPLVVQMDGSLFVLIGSHSHIFACIEAVSGSVKWETALDGRIECSAAITGDFSQVVVGCYKGKIYFLDLITGLVLWQFQTGGEVKMQPISDHCRSLIWCGSHDHFLYAFNYKTHSCVFKINCGGSVYGSPCIDMVQNLIYVASTSGRVTAISLEATTFKVLWLYQAGSPIFGSLSLDNCQNVICCSVDGCVAALDSKGAVVWKASVGGPIFAGVSVSSALPNQVLICSRDGSVYSFNLDGALLWKYEAGDPITASAYVDELTRITSVSAKSYQRLACICTSSGSIHVISIREDAGQKNVIAGLPETELVHEFATMNLAGDIFSSPVMIGGRIFVGCRDDHVYCIKITCE